MRDLNIFYQERPNAVFGLRSLLFFYIFIYMAYNGKGRKDALPMKF